MHKFKLWLIDACACTCAYNFNYLERLTNAATFHNFNDIAALNSEFTIGDYLKLKGISVNEVTVVKHIFDVAA